MTFNKIDHNNSVTLSTSDNKLTLVVDNVHGLVIRYRKKGDSHWQAKYLKEQDYEKAIDKILESFSEKE